MPSKAELWNQILEGGEIVVPMTFKGPRYFFVFDAESIGLYGETFQVGWLTLDSERGDFEDEGQAECHPDLAMDFDRYGHTQPVRAHREQPSLDRNWVNHNVPRITGSVADPQAVGAALWYAWERAQRKHPKDIWMAADCPFPVEANMLISMMREGPGAIRQSPYPLLDIGSILFAAGRNPEFEYPREPSELPQHQALPDARQSARLLFEALFQLREK